MPQVQMANFLNEHIIMTALARVCRRTSRPLTCGYFQVNTDLEDSGSARAQNAAQFFQSIGGGIIVACCAFFILLCFLLYFVFFVVYVFLWYVVVFLLYFVFLWYGCGFCVVVGLRLFVESGVGVVCFYGEARVTICWTQG